MLDLNSKTPDFSLSMGYNCNNLQIIKMNFGILNHGTNMWGAGSPKVFLKPY
jgi:hypothetical protein